MPGRGPRWRLRHAGMLFATNEHARRQEAGESATDPDAIFATSMLALADLRAALPGTLRSKPHVLYMHENQAAYPVSDHVERTIRDQDSHLAFTNLASIEAADRVLWNSVWNRDSFIAGMETTLAHAPERSVDRWQDRLLNKSVITPPPIEPPEETEAPNNAPNDADATVLHNSDLAGYPDAVRVAWPHRWEHDKGCDELLQIAQEARRRESQGGPRIHWLVLGQRFPRVPDSMTTFLSEHHDRIELAGHLPSNDYHAALNRADWVLSTARHEFFGMAVAEALLAGCLPWLPNRLSYPELVPPEALELNPWKVASGSAGPLGGTVSLGRLQEAIRERLAPAAAPTAVQRIEQEVRLAVEG